MSHWHLMFDLLAYGSAWTAGRLFAIEGYRWQSDDQKWYYYTAVTVGFVTGAVALSTLNNYLSLGVWVAGKSILGALAGAIVAAELCKRIYGIETSTGAPFVLPLAAGIAVGRLGCFVTGLEDFTYGVATSLPWGVDFGDGIARHPVQLYESMAMLLFFLYARRAYRIDDARFEATIFYRFVLFYAVQRFVWEFFKPYVAVAVGLNLFQWVCLGLTLYALYHLQRSLHGAV